MKTQSTLFATVLVLILSAITQVTIAGTYSGGTGDPNDPYQIATAQDLIELSLDSNDWEASFVLSSNIDMTDQSITPIGRDVENPFKGQLDGANHAIHHLTSFCSETSFIC